MKKRFTYWKALANLPAVTQCEGVVRGEPVVSLRCGSANALSSQSCLLLSGCKNVLNEPNSTRAETQLNVVGLNVTK